MRGDDVHKLTIDVADLFMVGLDIDNISEDVRIGIGVECVSLDWIVLVSAGVSASF